MNHLQAHAVLREQLGWILRDSYAGFRSFTHSSLSVVGLTALIVVGLFISQPQLHDNFLKLVTVQERELSSTSTEPVADPGAMDQLAKTALHYAAQTTALLGLNQSLEADTSSAESVSALSEVKSPALTKQQKGVARYLAGKYHVNQTAVELLVIAAHETGQQINMEPSLLLAVMAVESGFNPFAQSSVGAQGLMQVMSKVHADKLDDFGGANAALNPVANLQVGALILKDCIRRGGSVQNGLRLYVGAGMGDDAGYGDKVLQEKQRIELAARGLTVSPSINVTTASAPTTPKVPAGAMQAVELLPHAIVNAEPQV